LVVIVDFAITQAYVANEHILMLRLAVGHGRLELEWERAHDQKKTAKHE
jgi:hypothetical protein